MQDIVVPPGDDLAATLPPVRLQLTPTAAPFAADARPGQGLHALHRLGFVAQLCLSAASLEQALQQACRLSPIWGATHCVYASRESAVTIRWSPEDAGLGATLAVEQAAEVLATWLQLVVCAAGPEAGPRAIHAPPAMHAALRALVQCPIRECGDGIMLCFDPALVRRPNPGADARLYAALLRYAEQRIVELADAESTIERVRKVLAQLEAPSVSAALVARRLGLGMRTLHRRLRIEGTTFRKVLDDHRLARCLVELQSLDTSAKQIAYTLGFADPASFHRAFKRWTGSTVRGFRDRADAAK